MLRWQPFAACSCVKCLWEPPQKARDAGQSGFLAWPSYVDSTVKSCRNPWLYALQAVVRALAVLNKEFGTVDSTHLLVNAVSMFYRLLGDPAMQTT